MSPVEIQLPDVQKIVAMHFITFLIMMLLFNIVIPKEGLPKIPGDIYIERPGGVDIHIPLVSAIFVAIVLSYLVNFFKTPTLFYLNSTLPIY